MIQITPQMRLLVPVEPVNFRCGTGGLCRLCRELDADPFSSCLALFRNQRATPRGIRNRHKRNFL